MLSGHLRSTTCLCIRRQQRSCSALRKLMLCSQFKDRHVAQSFRESSSSSRDAPMFPTTAPLSSRLLPPAAAISQSVRHYCKSGNSSKPDTMSDSFSRMFAAVPVEEESEAVNVGEELAGPLNKTAMLNSLNQFYTDTKMKDVAKDYGIDTYLFKQAFISFRKYCASSKTLPTDLHIILSDIAQGAGHFHDIFPSFLQHAREVFPHLMCIDDLFKISDLTNPPNWYHDARAMNRRIVFHAGPTNSGKTYHAMQQFLQAESGVYCGPLKMLATEVYTKSNEKGTPCDLITGEERRYAIGASTPAQHIACTTEMTSITAKYDVGIIDEIQLMRDPQRGWAWTRSFLGLCAKEVHVCGEEAAIPLVKELVEATQEELEIVRYKRLTSLIVEDKCLDKLSDVQPGDCFVCFSKQDIHTITRGIEKLGHQVAVIYGSLPPGTKLAQARKFNDPSHPCKIMVATDAIGMGLNLSIRRIIFNSLVKPTINEKGEREIDTISVSQALQIAGRAGRYATQYDTGYVTTRKDADMPVLRRLLSSVPEDIEKAGLHPTAEQIELFAYQIPEYKLSNLIDIFVNLCKVDKDMYFMCAMEDFKFLADLIQHISLPLRSRYVFCCAPINRKLPYVCTLFLKMVRQFGQSEAATFSWICRQVKWPPKPPRTIADLVMLEAIFDVLDIYLWLSYRFSDMYPDGDEVRDIQHELDEMIEEGVTSLTSLVENTMPAAKKEALDAEEYAIMSVRQSMDLSRETRQGGLKGELDPGFLTEQDKSQRSMHHESDLVSSDDDNRQTAGFDATGRSKVKGVRALYKPGKGGGPLPMTGKGRLAKYLLGQGFLTTEMLEQLKEEWQHEKPGRYGDQPTQPKHTKKKKL